MEAEVRSLIIKSKIIAIIRRMYDVDVVKVAQALYAGGVQLVEVTFDQSDSDNMRKTFRQIMELNKALSGRMLFGAGTVLTTAQVDAAADAGAQFLLSPDTNEDVIKRTKERGLVSIPGAMSPTEIMNAHRWGADFVKVFPAGNLGQSYIKGLMEPISHISLIATGGIDSENLSDFLDIGVVGAGIGGNLVDRQLIAAGDFGALTERARKFREIARTHGTQGGGQGA